MPPAFFVDTNVVVYAYDTASASKRQVAIELLEGLGATGRGLISTQVLQETYNALTRKITPPLTHDEAERVVRDYATVWDATVVTVSVILDAMAGVRAHRLPFGDALIWATAKSAGATHVLSEDGPTGTTLQGIRFLNPFAEGFALP